MQIFKLDKIEHQDTIEQIRSMVEFKGIKLWLLILAVLIASIGLNTNSSLVLIGAMFIAPLLGPISAAGLALGISDTALLRRSLFNLALITIVSLLISTAYFSLSPLREASPEMIARTSPSFFDVLIAFLGGAAMILAMSYKVRASHVVAGIAMATALMPPLCIAGYGIATKDWQFFFGGFYLYLIDSIFIGLAAYLSAVLFKIERSESEKPRTFKRTQVLATIAALIVFVAPSMWFAVDMSLESAFAANVQRFAKKAMDFKDSQVIDLAWNRKINPAEIKVTLVGAPLSAELVTHLSSLLPEYQLEGASLQIIQSQLPASANTANPISEAAPIIQESTPNLSPISSPVIVAQPTAEQNQSLFQLEQEALLAFPDIDRISWGDLANQKPVAKSAVFIRWRGTVSAEIKARFAAWLRLRTGNNEITTF